MPREIEFPTEWAIPPVVEQDKAGDGKRPASRAAEATNTPPEEAASFPPETFLRGTYA
jgi:hypothetical protein